MSNDDIIETLNDLIETSKDGEYGFRTSAEHMEAGNLRELFARYAQECRQSAEELQMLVHQHGGDAEHGGSFSGALHRGWVAVKSTLAGYTDKAILEEAERGEDLALQSYRTALDKGLPPVLQSVVERQYEGVKRNHLEVRTLRDQARAAVS